MYCWCRCPRGKLELVDYLDPKRVDAIFVQRPYDLSIQPVQTKYVAKLELMHAVIGPGNLHVVGQSFYIKLFHRLVSW